MRGLFDVLPPKETCQEGKPGAVFGDEAVQEFGDVRDAGNVLVEPEGPTLARRDGQRAEDRFGSRIDMSVRVDKLDCLLALLASQFGKAFSDTCVLERDVLDAIAGALLPTGDPATAEIAVAVEDQ